MPRIITVFLLLFAAAAPSQAAERKWQTGTWADVTVKRRIVDFGPGSSGFGRPGATPQMRAMADIRQYVIETVELRLEMEDTVAVGRQSIEAMVGHKVTFALEKNSVYVRDDDGTEHKLRLTKKVALSAAASGSAPPSPRGGFGEPRRSSQESPTSGGGKASAERSAYAALGGGHLVRAVSDNGRYVTLEDGSRWEIAPQDRYQTVDWNAQANISVRMLPRAENGFAYELVNTSDDEGAVANYIGK